MLLALGKFSEEVAFEQTEQIVVLMKKKKRNLWHKNKEKYINSRGNSTLYYDNTEYEQPGKRLPGGIPTDSFRLYHQILFLLTL